MTVNNSIFKTLQPSINLVLSSTDNKDVYRFFTKVFGKNNVYGLEDTEFLHRPIHLVVCVNKVDMIEKSLHMAYFLHVPIVIIDMSEKPNMLAIQKISPPKMTYLQIATNIEVAKSWGFDDYHDILPMDITNPECIAKWKNTLTNVAQATYHMHIQHVTDSEYNEHEEPKKYSFDN